MIGQTLKYIRMQVSILFPEGHCCCDLCPLLETYARKQCRKTGEYIADTKGRGAFCPLYDSHDEVEVEVRYDG